MVIVVIVINFGILKHFIVLIQSNIVNLMKIIVQLLFVNNVFLAEKFYVKVKNVVYVKDFISQLEMMIVMQMHLNLTSNGNVLFMILSYLNVLVVEKVII